MQFARLKTFCDLKPNCKTFFRLLLTKGKKRGNGGQKHNKFHFGYVDRL